MPPPQFSMIGAGIFLPILGLLLWGKGAHAPRLWSAAELRPHDGNLPHAPSLLLACMGEVFDVTKAPQFYGREGGYRNFTGRDGSRAFIRGDFRGPAVSDDVSDFTPVEMHSLEDWRQFYHKTYPFKGVLAGGAFYDARGALQPPPRPISLSITLQHSFGRRVSNPSIH